MFTSMVIRSALAFSAFALTQSAGAGAALAATVVSTAHYQRQLTLDCPGGSICAVAFPPAAVNRRLKLTRISCLLTASSGSEFKQGQIVLRNATNFPLLNEYLPSVLSASDGTHTLNQAIDVQVTESQYIYVFLQLASGNGIASHCTLTGTQDTLQ
jgi:hypothetical protein